VCIICCHLDHSKYCRMMWIIELIQRKVLTVNRQRILCQIICSNTEEINFFCKKITDHNCSRCLDHYTLLYVIFKRNALLCQLFLNLCNNSLDLFYFCYRDDHRIHNGDISEHTCSEQCTKLCLKYFRSVQADTDCTITHCRILLVCHIKVINLLVCADIQCTDDYFLSCHILCYCFINLELLFLCRIIIFFQINEFTSEKTNTFCIISQYTGYIACASDVCVQMNLMSTLCLCSFAF